MRVLGYCRVSTAEQAENGVGLDAQREAIRAEADRRGWDVTWIEDRGYSGKDLDRPGIEQALTLLREGGAETLVVARLDRLSRSLYDFTGVVERSDREGWAVVALDFGVDTTTPAGEMMVNVLAVFARYERRIISQRIKDALAVKKANGVRLGRPRAVPPPVRERIVRERVEGATLAQIADRLNEEGVPTVKRGARWHPSTVGAILRQMEAA